MIYNRYRIVLRYLQGGQRYVIQSKGLWCWRDMKITSLGNLVRHSKGWSTDLADFSSLEIAESSLFKYFNSLRPDAVLKTYDAEKHLANRQSRSSTHWKDDPTMNPPGGVANKYQNEHPRYRSMPVEQTPENPSNTIAE